MNKALKSAIKVLGVIFAIASIAAGIAFVCERINEWKNQGAELIHRPFGFYEHYLKRPLDCFLATLALIVLSPVILAMMITGRIAMKGNPFFTQDRPGKIDPGTGKEKIFKLIKMRTMSNEKDPATGELLPDAKRLNSYGRFLRATSADELGELLNIIKGDMAIVGPRPLLVEYLPWYTKEEHHRHDVRPGLTGWAQVNGRNNLDWDKRLQCDLHYVENVSLLTDIRIILMTVRKVLSRSDISSDTAASEGNFAKIRESMRRKENEYSDS